MNELPASNEEMSLPLYKFIIRKYDTSYKNTVNFRLTNPNLIQILN